MIFAVIYLIIFNYGNLVEMCLFKLGYKSDRDDYLVGVKINL